MNNTVNHDHRTIDQRRAEYALGQIEKIKEQQYGNYVSYVSALPASIVMNGLGQALLTLLAKAKGAPEEPHYLLYNHVASWLSQQSIKLRSPSESDFTPVITRMMEADQKTYLFAQAEAMAYLNWLKQFARAYLKEKEGQSE